MSAFHVHATEACPLTARYRNLRAIYQARQLAQYRDVPPLHMQRRDAAESAYTTSRSSSTMTLTPLLYPISFPISYEGVDCSVDVSLRSVRSVRETACTKRSATLSGSQLVKSHAESNNSYLEASAADPRTGLVDLERRNGRTNLANMAVVSAPKPKAAKKKRPTMTLLQFVKSATACTFEVMIVNCDHCTPDRAKHQLTCGNE